MGCPGYPSLRRVALTAGDTLRLCPSPIRTRLVVMHASSLTACGPRISGVSAWQRGSDAAHRSRVYLSLSGHLQCQSRRSNPGGDRRFTGSVAGVSLFPDRPSSLVWLFAVMCHTAYVTASLKSILPVRMFLEFLGQFPPVCIVR